MGGFSFDWQTPCTPEEVRRALVDPGLYVAFAEKQKAESQEVEVEPEAGTARLRWVVRMPPDVPAIVRRLVGDPLTLEIRVAIDPAEQRLDLDAIGRRRGQVRSDLAIEPDGSGSRLSLRGSMGVSGIGGSQAASTARDEVVKPILRENFFPLLDSWCSTQD